MYQGNKAAALVMAAGLALAGCAGAKVIDEPVEFTPAAPLGSAQDRHAEAVLEWVIFRGGPGSWARNADWDEYLLVVHNRSASALRVTSVTVVDSLDASLGPDNDRKRLVKASRENGKRYKDASVTVKAGASGDALAAAGALGTGLAYGAGTAVMAYGGGSAVAAGVIGGLLLGPVLVVGGMIKSANQREVAQEIHRRHTALPVEIPVAGSRPLDLFFPLAPSPRRIELRYMHDDGEGVLSIDVSAALAGLHLDEEAAR